MKVLGVICSQKQIDECQTIQLSVDDSQQQPPDYSQLGEVWGLAFSSVLFLWLFSHGIGYVLKMVKNG